MNSSTSHYFLLLCRLPLPPCRFPSVCRQVLFCLHGVKKAAGGRFFGTRDVKNNILRGSVMFPDEDGNASGGRRRSPTGRRGPAAQRRFCLVSKHICQSSKSQNKSGLSGDARLAVCPVINHLKLTVSGCKDDNIGCERTSEGEGNATPHSSMVPLSHYINQRVCHSFIQVGLLKLFSFLHILFNKTVIHRA